MLNLSSILEDSAARYASNPAFTLNDTTLNYAQANAMANQVAHGLTKLGITKGDKVALSCLNLPYFPIVYFGILKAGAAIVPLSVLLKKDEIAFHLKDSQAKAYFCFQGTDELPMGQWGYEGFQQAEGCEQFVIITPTLDMPSPIAGIQTLGQLLQGCAPEYNTVMTTADDTAVIVYTSGTTGSPKGAELTHVNLLINAMVSAGLSKVQHDDKQLIVLPLFHIFAMTVQMNAGILKGASNILLPRFDPEAVFALMQKHEITIFAGVPTMYWGLLHYEEPKFDYKKIANTLKICCSGGASLPVQVMKDFEARFEVPIIEGYGMSEGSPVVTFNQLEIGCKPGSIGTPVWGVQVKLVDAEGQEVPVGEKGELVYKGHNVMKGYFNRPENNKATIKDGWMHSGDIAVKDEEGFYYIVDRTKDMILRGGLNVYPREVEEVMIKHEAISLVAVIGVPHEEHGEEVKAYVVLNDGMSVDKEALKAWVKAQIAAYKYPREIEFVDALPMSATGKILKKELRKQGQAKVGAIAKA